MTEKHVLKRLRLIELVAATGDNERAHRLEAALRRSVLRALAEANPIAALALRSEAIRFARWYA